MKTKYVIWNGGNDEYVIDDNETGEFQSSLIFSDEEKAQDYANFRNGSAGWMGDHKVKKVKTNGEKIYQIYEDYTSIQDYLDEYEIEMKDHDEIILTDEGVLTYDKGFSHVS